MFLTHKTTIGTSRRAQFVEPSSKRATFVCCCADHVTKCVVPWFGPLPSSSLSASFHSFPIHLAHCQIQCPPPPFNFLLLRVYQLRCCPEAQFARPYGMASLICLPAGTGLANYTKTTTTTVPLLSCNLPELPVCVHFRNCRIPSIPASAQTWLVTMNGYGART